MNASSAGGHCIHRDNDYHDRMLVLRRATRLKAPRNEEDDQWRWWHRGRTLLRVVLAVCVLARRGIHHFELTTDHELPIFARPESS